MKSLLPIGKNIVKVLPSIKNAEKKLINQNIVISHNIVRDNTKELYNKQIQEKNKRLKEKLTIYYIYRNYNLLII